jgi:hypothetical protein
VHANAAEDPRVKLNRITSLIDQSNRVIDSLNLSLENNDAILAEIEDAIDAKMFDAVQGF